MNKPTTSPKNFSTPTQLLEMHPYAQEIGWTTKEIEFLFENKLLDGKRSNELLISDESFERMLNFHRKQQEE